MREALRIGEFSALGRVSVRMLRHYEKLGLLTPAHTDASSGYRYYSLDQLSHLNRIIALKELGFALEQVGAILADGPSAEQMQDLLTQRRETLAAEITRSTRRLEQVDLRLAQIQREGRPPEDSEVVVKSLPAAWVASVRSIVPAVEQTSSYCDDHFGRLGAWLGERGIPAAGLTMNLYHMDQYRETDLDMESVVVIDPAWAPGLPEPAPGGIGVRLLEPQEQAASLVLLSGFSGIEGGVMTLLGWVAASGLQLSGPLREVHLFGHPDLVGGTEPAVLELVVLVRARTS